MKNLKKLEKILIMLLVITVLCGLATISNATSSIGDIVDDIPVLQATPTPTPSPAPTATPTPTPSPIAQNNQTGNTTLPKTGANDTIMWVLIGACAIAAVYTYKKVRDYNV